MNLPQGEGQELGAVPGQEEKPGKSLEARWDLPKNRGLTLRTRKPIRQIVIAILQ